MNAKLPVFLSVLRLMASRDLGVRRDIVLGVLNDLAAIALSLAGPVLLKGIVEDLAGPAPPLRLGAEVVLFVLSWVGPAVLAAQKLVHTTQIVEALSLRLLSDGLSGQWPRFARAELSGQAPPQALLELLPTNLQIVVDGLLWRLAPLVLQTGLSVVVLWLNVPAFYVGLLCLTFLAFVLTTRIGARDFADQTDAAMTASMQVSSLAADLLRNARRVVSNGAESVELDRLETLAGRRRRAAEALSWAVVRLTASQIGVLGAGLLVVFGFAVGGVGGSKPGVGTFVLLQAFALRLASPLGQASTLLRQSGLALEALGKTIDLGGPEPRRSEAVPSPVRIPPAAIALRGVGFQHGSSDFSLGPIDVVLPSGGIVALAGANGSGKSTLAQLLGGLRRPGSGCVLIDGQDLERTPPAARPRLALYVPQFISLFDRTLGENLCYPPSGLDEAMGRDLLQDWSFDEGGRPVDLALRVGELGARLSGGQVQKLELARLTGVETRLLILDESTSALDVQSQRRVLTDLRRALPRTTIVVVTHEREVAEGADKVIFLRHGRLAGFGAHADLVRSNADYRHLWDPSE